MTDDIRLVQPPFDAAFVDDFVDCVTRVFGSGDRGTLAWRLENMPDVTVFAARHGERMIGFKAGYAATRRRYYSWLGGVDPAFRRQGIARRMMEHQHRWLDGTGYELVETHVRQENGDMIRLNLDFGFAITGMFLRSGDPNYIMQKVLDRG